jgi:hypothetical protein
MLLDIMIINFVFTKNETNADACDVVSTLLKYVSSDICSRCRLTLFGISNFNFEQLQRTVFELNFFRFSCNLIYYPELHGLITLDHIQQLPLFNQFKLVSNISDAVKIYKSKWTNANRASLK